MSGVTVRPYRAEDLAPLTELANHYVRETPYTFQLEPFSLEEQRGWVEEHADHGPHRILVAVAEAELAGFASSSRYRPRGAYETSVETSVYAAPGWTGRGVGSRLYTALFEMLAGEEVHRAYAVITMPNPASVALHQRFGFRQAGYFTEQGRKFGQYWDVAWYEKPLG
jgi:phosphinothricin acetyltransferase